MFKELATAMGLDYACMVYGIDIKVLQNITVNLKTNE